MMIWGPEGEVSSFQIPKIMICLYGQLIEAFSDGHHKCLFAKAWPEPYKRFFVKALPEAVLRYFSKLRAFFLSVKAMAVLIFHGTCFEVCLHFFWL